MRDGGFGQLLVEVKPNSPLHVAILQQYRAVQQKGVEGMNYDPSSKPITASANCKQLYLVFFLHSAQHVSILPRYNAKAELAKWVQYQQLFFSILNIGQVAGRLIYFQCQKITFLVESIRKSFFYYLKTEALYSTSSVYFAADTPVRSP